MFRWRTHWSEIELSVFQISCQCPPLCLAHPLLRPLSQRWILHAFFRVKEQDDDKVSICLSFPCGIQGRSPSDIKNDDDSSDYDDDTSDDDAGDEDGADIETTYLSTP